MRIILMDDHALFGNALKDVCLGYKEIETFDFVDTMETMEEKLTEKPDAILLLDINLNDLGISDSFILASRLIEEHPGLKLAFLSGYDKSIYRKRAKDIGAKGFFSKAGSMEELIDGLGAIEKGRMVFNREDGLLAERCSPTEARVLEMSAKGMSRKEIAEVLKVSERTVSTHITNIFSKLGAKNITEAISIALEKGYIPPQF